MRAPTYRRQWSASEEASYYTGRGLVILALLLIAGALALEACRIPSPEWVEKALLMLLGGILTAYNSRPEQRTNTLSLQSEGNPPPALGGAVVPPLAEEPA